tara:strand:- start:6830 stop:7942 length:1113 start_codon:yes stop_codon:yes gene_type:complete
MKMLNAQSMYALSIDQVVDLITAVGSTRTVFVQGHMGSGKTSGIKRGLIERHPDHVYVEFDCTNKDIQDLSVPKYMAAVEGMVSDYCAFVPNEELGAHLGKKLIINFDEVLKAPLPVQKGVRRIWLERMVNGIALPEGSIIYGTSNLGAEGLGDLLAAHQRNAIIVVQMRKSDNMEFIEWGINNGIDARVLGWCKDNPQLFASFEDVKDPEENPWIHHPRAVGRAACVTGRSLEAASDILKIQPLIDEQTLTATLMGTIGDRGAMDLMAFVKLADQLPSLESIKQDPQNAKVPDSASAVCMVVYRTLASLDKTWVDAWMDYMPRLDKEAQGMFANGVRAPKYSKQSMVMTNRKFTEWAMANNYMFAADKK